MVDEAGPANGLGGGVILKGSEPAPKRVLLLCHALDETRAETLRERT